MPGGPRSAAGKPANRAVRVLGPTAVAWLAAIAILGNGFSEQLRAVNALLKQWNDPEKEDLRHRGLPLDF